MAISNLPGCQSGTFSEACLTETQFNAMTHLNRKMNCDPVLEMSYKKAVETDILNCGRQASDFTQIMSLIGATGKKNVPATELWQRVMCSKNYNVLAAQNVSGGQGAQVEMTLAAVNHANGGKGSNLAQGFELYHYRTQQTYTVISVDKTVDYAHKVVMVSFSNKATDIRKGDTFFVTSARTIGGSACSIAPSTLLAETGYAIKSSPLRLEESYCFETKVDTFGQKEIYLFDLLDDKGNKFQYWEPWIKAQKRLSLDRAKSVKFLLGSKIENPNHPLFGDEFSGFDGYINRIKYGGGRYEPISMSGLTIANIDMVEAAARGYGITEFTWVIPHAHRVMLERNLQPMFNANAGSCTFASFERSGMDREAVKKLGISSYSQNGFTHHFKTAEWADYPELLGNDFLKHSTFVMPTYGAKDAYGRTVPTFENLNPVGMKGVDSSYFEQDDDLRKRAPFCEEIRGVMREVLWLKINCIENHWMFEAKADC